MKSVRKCDSKWYATTKKIKILKYNPCSLTGIQCWVQFKNITPVVTLILPAPCRCSHSSSHLSLPAFYLPPVAAPILPHTCRYSSSTCPLSLPQFYRPLSLPHSTCSLSPPLFDTPPATPIRPAPCRYSHSTCPLSLPPFYLPLVVGPSGHEICPM